MHEDLKAENGGRLARLREQLFESIEIRRLAYARVVLGFFMALQAFKIAVDADGIRRYFTDSPILFKYPFLSGLAPLSQSGMEVLCWLLTVAGVGVMVGAFYRICATIYCVGWVYLFFLDAQFYQNHFYLLMLFGGILVFLPAHRSFSWDAKRRPEVRTSWVPRWTLLILQAQLAVAYVGGAFAKMSPDWLAGEPMRKWMSDPRRADKIPVLGSYFGEEWLVLLLTYSGLLLDLLIVPAILWRRTRYLALASILMFHLMNSVLWNIGIFPWFMICFTPILLPARVFRMGQPGEHLGQGQRDELAVPESTRRWVVGCLIVFSVFHLTMPFRHLLYPGPSIWTEEGGRFAWHMKLRDKGPPPNSSGRLPQLPVYSMRSAAQNKQWNLNASQLLEMLMKPEVERDVEARTRAFKRAHYMSIHPDMLVQFAHYLRDIYRDQGISDVEVRVRILNSLNTREPQYLIDPAVDLAQVELSLGHSQWIQPLTTPLPDRASPRE